MRYRIFMECFALFATEAVFPECKEKERGTLEGTWEEGIRRGNLDGGRGKVRSVIGRTADDRRIRVEG